MQVNSDVGLGRNVKYVRTINRLFFKKKKSETFCEFSWVLIDSQTGSQRAFITEEAADPLAVPKQKYLQMLSSY